MDGDAVDRRSGTRYTAPGFVAVRRLDGAAEDNEHTATTVAPTVSTAATRRMCTTPDYGVPIVAPTR